MIIDKLRLLETILYKLEYVERELARLNRHERRFDQIDAELAKQGRMEKIERDLSKVAQSSSALATDLKNFSVEITSRIKHIEVLSTEGSG